MNKLLTVRSDYKIRQLKFIQDLISLRSEKPSTAHHKCKFHSQKEKQICCKPYLATSNISMLIQGALESVHIKWLFRIFILAKHHEPSMYTMRYIFFQAVGKGVLPDGLLLWRIWTGSTRRKGIADQAH